MALDGRKEGGCHRLLPQGLNAYSVLHIVMQRAAGPFGPSPLRPSPLTPRPARCTHVHRQRLLLTPGQACHAAAPGFFRICWWVQGVAASDAILLYVAAGGYSLCRAKPRSCSMNTCSRSSHVGGSNHGQTQSAVPHRAEHPPWTQHTPTRIHAGPGCLRTRCLSRCSASQRRSRSTGAAGRRPTALRDGSGRAPSLPHCPIAVGPSPAGRPALH